MQQFGQYDEMTAFTLDAVVQSMEVIRGLRGGGTEVVARREGEYKSWDPETFRIDKEAEDRFIACVQEAGLNAVLLSEEAKRKDLSTPATASQPRVYVISDPFDGSLLYKRGIPAFWYTTLAVYSESGEPLTAVIGDCNAQTLTFCDRDRAYTGQVVAGELADVVEIRPTGETELSAACLETYLMKPKFMYPAAIQFQPLFSQVKFILPNGGPAAFGDVAAARTDVYFAYQQPYIEIFSGVAVAQRAGCTVTTFEGEELVFEDNIEASYNVLCSATPELHEKVLNQLRALNWS